MNSLQVSWSETKPWDLSVLDALGGPPHLVLAFWSAPDEMVQYPLKTLTEAYPHALILGCSTAGEIVGTQVLDGQLTATAIRFAHSKVQGRAVRTADFPGSLEAGKALAEMLPHENLVHVLVLSDGLKVNGSELVRGMTAGLPPTVTITGGLAADGDRFQQTSVFWEGRAESGTIVAVGLYGDKLKIGYGSMGGWDTFGPERMITSSQGNVLFEMDGESALGLYELYLGKQAEGLPATGLLFPLSIRQEDTETRLVRTILSIDRTAQSLTFAGDVPTGALAQLMKANFNRLVDGACDAALAARIGEAPCDLAILISCVGRKLILGQMVEEEVEGVADILGPTATLTGFYSYGEIAPLLTGGTCELHNQTMTITTITELD